MEGLAATLHARPTAFYPFADMPVALAGGLVLVALVLRRELARMSELEARGDLACVDRPIELDLGVVERAVEVGAEFPDCRVVVIAQDDDSGWIVRCGGRGHGQTGSQCGDRGGGEQSGSRKHGSLQVR